LPPRKRRQNKLCRTSGAGTTPDLALKIPPQQPGSRHRAAPMPYDTIQ
jgi:hypothetical protein